MKPEAEPSRINREQSGSNFELHLDGGKVEYTPDVPLESSTEKVEQTSELGAIASDVVITTSLPTPVDDTVAVDENTTIQGAPIVASDDDLIEKEWVDKAKKIIADTKDNPRKRESEVGKLKIDYIRKRYGREIGASE